MDTLARKGSGLKEGSDFHLVFSPERVYAGRVFADLCKYPKLVGALSEEGARRAVEFYEAVPQFDERSDLARPNGVWDLGTAEAVELAKLAETTYRGIPVYPRLYLSTDPNAEIVRNARLLNVSMPERLVKQAEEMLGSLSGERAVVLGVSYRGGVKESAFSGVFLTVEALRERGANVYVHDPLYSDEELRALGFEPYELGGDIDLAILHTAHADYREISPDQLPGVKLLVDDRAATDAARWAGTPRIVVGVGAR